MFEKFPIRALAALVCAGAVFTTGCGDPDCRNDAERQFLKAAMKGDADAQYSLGASYEFGGGAERDIDLAKKWYAKAAGQGHAKAKARLRHLNPPDKAAVDKFRTDAKSGDADAQFSYGECCERGIHVPRDPDEALRWYLRAAKQGNGDAKSRIRELTPDRETVKKYLADAKRGNAEAQYNLGRCFEFGFQVRRNMDTARNWYARAARQGYAPAAGKLGRRPAKKRPVRR